MRAKSLLRGAAILTTGVLGGSCNSDDPAGGSAAGGSTLGAKKLTVVVAVIDSLMPDEITAATPNLKALKDGGTYYTQSRSIFNAETIPNHVAMMTGVNPDRSGIVANSFVDLTGASPAERNLSRPEDLAANTLFTWIRRNVWTARSTPRCAPARPCRSVICSRSSPAMRPIRRAPTATPR